MTEENSNFWHIDPEEELMEIYRELRVEREQNDLRKDALTRIAEALEMFKGDEKGAQYRLANIQRIITTLNADIKRVSH